MEEATEESASKETKDYKRIWTLFGTLSFSFASLALVLFLLRPDPPKSLWIEGIQVLSKEEVLAFLGVETGNLVKVEEEWEGYEAKLLTHPRIRSAKVTLERKGVLKLLIVEKRTEFLLHSGSRLFEIDEEGRILEGETLRSFSHPILSGPFEVLGETVQGSSFSAMVSSLRLAFERYPELRDRVSEVQLLSDGEFLLFTKSPFRSKIFLGESLPLQQFRKLYASLAFLESQGRKVREIDLRGEDAVYH